MVYIFHEHMKLAKPNVAHPAILFAFLVTTCICLAYVMPFRRCGVSKNCVDCTNKIWLPRQRPLGDRNPISQQSSIPAALSGKKLVKLGLVRSKVIAFEWIVKTEALAAVRVRCDPTWHASSRSGVAVLHCEVLYPSRILHCFYFYQQCLNVESLYCNDSDN